MYDAICVEMTPAAPRFRTASRHNTPRDRFPQHDRALDVLAGEVSGGAGTDVDDAVPSVRPERVENELMASETRSCSRDSTGADSPAIVTVPRE